MLIFDGSARDNPGVTGLGGIIRDEGGSPILSFSSPCFCTTNKAEMIPLRMGLQEDLQLNICQIFVEGYSLLVTSPRIQGS